MAPCVRRCVGREFCRRRLALRGFPSFPRVARIPEIGRLESDSGSDYATARSAAELSWRRPLERYIYACKGPLASQQCERGIDWWRDGRAGNRDTHRLCHFAETRLQLG